MSNSLDLISGDEIRLLEPFQPMVDGVAVNRPVPAGAQGEVRQVHVETEEVSAIFAVELWPYSRMLKVPFSQVEKVTP